MNELGTVEQIDLNTLDPEALLEKMNPSVVERFLEELPGKAFQLGIRILLVVISLMIGIQLIKLIRSLIKKGMRRQKVDESAVRFVDSFIKFFLYAVLIMMTASALGVDATSIVALVGSASVAIGLALQGSLSNLAGGVLILVLKPFTIGDWISDGAGNEGEVTNIDIFYTHLITADRKRTVLPNGTLANGTIINASREPKRRIDVQVGISYDSDIKAARDALLAMLGKDLGVLQNEEKIVFVDSFGDNGVNLNVRCYTKTEDYWTTKWRVTENVKYALDQAGIEIPYPQVDVHTK